MSAPTTSTTIRMERLCRRYRIIILREQSESDWPQEHLQVIKHVKELAEKRYDSYAMDEVVLQEDPWKLQAKERAMVLKELAHRCRSRREATWRFHCESLVFSRFNSEVTCKDCHKRLWRSEIEASRFEEGKTARALRRRQELRTPCRCIRLCSAVSYHLSEPAGLNKIFGHREQEPMIQCPGLMKELPMGKEPDAVYGLRQTRNFDALLNGLAKIQDINSPAEQLLRDVVAPSPMVEDGELLLFPFLIYESKKESGSDWHSVVLQGAFPIREALISQKSVKDKTGAASKWPSGPFCWFVTNRGSDWRVFACFTRRGEEKRGTEGATDYCIAPLWGGSILTLDGALQLLLLTDYIFDWARDIYREDLLRELGLLSSNLHYASSVLISDSDIMSTRGLSPPVAMAEPVPYEQSYSHPPAHQNAFKALDRPQGCIRHASTAEFRYSSLFLTHDTVESFIQSLHTREAQSVSRVILELKAQILPLLFSFKDLNTLRTWWTGVDHGSQSTLPADKFFWTYLVSYNYIAPGWQVVSELCLVAIDEKAFQHIAYASDSTAEPKPSPPSAHAAPYDFRHITQLRHLLAEMFLGSAKILSDAISRRVRAFGVSRLGPAAMHTDIPLKGVLDSLHQSSQMRQNGASETYQHVSHRLLPPASGNGSLGDLPVCTKGCILVHGTLAPDDEGTRSTICIFFLRGEPQLPSDSAIRESLEHCFTNHDVYHTTLNNETCNLQALEIAAMLMKRTWNLQRTYGMFTLGPHFTDWMKFLGCKVPQTQGALRARNLKKGGRTLLLRELNPWRDPRYKYPNISTHVFLAYKLFSREKAFWDTVAKEKLSQGLICCNICAAEDEEDDDIPLLTILCRRHNICQFCHSRVHNRDLPRWLRKPYGGNLIKIRLIDDYELRNRILGLSGIPQELLFEGVDEWEKNLNFYPRLNEGFKDMDELYSQLTEFQEYRKRILGGRSESLEIMYSKKRKRGHGGDYDDIRRGYDDGIVYLGSL